jgi:uncharacterized protein YgbK (DUF1537 family)
LQLVILADDFTGAGDAAAPFAAARRTLVVLSATESRARSDSAGVDVLAVDLDLRESADREAEQKTDAVARQLCSAASEPRVYLKIDSTLRGPIAALVAGALSGSGKDLAVIAPAFPEQGRFLHEGRVVVDGQPGASLTALLGMDGTALLGAKFVRSAGEVEQAVAHARMRGARRVVVDADSTAGLQRVAGAWRHHPDWLLVGSGGLARHVAPAVPSGQVLELPPVSGPVLVIAGSPTPMTAAQIDRLTEVASLTVVAANATPPRLPPPHRLLVLCTPPTSQRDAGESAQAVADTVGAWSERVRPGAVVLAGGATARKVCARLGAIGIRLSGELSPGVPIGRLVGGVWDQVLVVTKAGGFGNPNTLLDVARSVGVLSG